MAPETVGDPDGTTAKTPASARSDQSPPRNNAPGPPVVSAPTRHITSSLNPPQLAHAVECGTQSATHSHTFPTMSKAPQLDLQFDREPVLAGPAELVTHVVEPSSALPESGVPAAAACHSWFVSSRFPERRQACSAWNQVAQAVGSTPATETA